MKNKNRNLSSIKKTEKAIFDYLYRTRWTEIIPGTYYYEREKIDSLQISATIRSPQVIGIDKFELNVIVTRYEIVGTKVSFHFKSNGKQIYRLEQSKVRNWHLQETINKQDHIELPLYGWRQAIGLILCFENCLPEFIKSIGIANCLKISKTY